jgi:hypothetical protein
VQSEVAETHGGAGAAIAMAIKSPKNMARGYHIESMPSPEFFLYPIGRSTGSRILRLSVTGPTRSLTRSHQEILVQIVEEGSDVQIQDPVILPTPPPGLTHCVQR